jgi:hypothetical protein
VCGSHRHFGEYCLNCGRKDTLLLQRIRELHEKPDAVVGMDEHEENVRGGFAVRIGEIALAFFAAGALYGLAMGYPALWARLLGGSSAVGMAFVFYLALRKEAGR